MQAAARAVYMVFGGLALLLGALALLRPELALPAEGVNPLTTHLVREQAAGGIFVGVMALWCAFHLERRRPVHLALLLFTALFAAIHWAEYLGDRRQIASPLVNSVPFLAFLVTIPRREG